MFTPVSMSEQLLFMTTRISGVDANGDEAVATGFFHTITTNTVGETAPLLVTNWHVPEAIVSGKFMMHVPEADADNPGQFHPLGKSIEIPMNDFRKWWIPHPNRAIDICAAPLILILKDAGLELNQTYRWTTTEVQILSDERLAKDLTAVEDVVMVGYPQGHWDDVNNLPIVRRGITASHAAVDFKGKPEGLVDMACFVGSSGSPIFQLNEGWIYNKSGSVQPGTRCILLGVLASAFLAEAEGTVEFREIPTVTKPIITTLLSSHLGCYVKAKELLVLQDEIRRQFGLEAAMADKATG
jgi:hypothetical protein